MNIELADLLQSYNIQFWEATGQYLHEVNDLIVIVKFPLRLNITQLETGVAQVDWQNPTLTSPRASTFLDHLVHHDLHQLHQVPTMLL